MPYFDSHLFQKRGEKRTLTLILDEGDSILECIKTGMKQQGLNEVTIEGMSGTIKEGIGSYMEGSRFMTKNFANDDVFNASGKYKLQVDQLWGNLHVIINVKSPLNVTLVKGKASQDLKIDMSFIEFIDLKAQTETKKIEPELARTEPVSVQAVQAQTVQATQSVQAETTISLDELNEQLQSQ
ncbi:MAG: hypothetical protein Q7K42_03375 [Candidatus Diapherotrites archaeon]|nr:hypothetical protein [Candidatus Diapherotrites archaeon]